MNKFEILQDTLAKEQIDIINFDFKGKQIKGLACDNVIGINKKIKTNAERFCIAKEEEGHLKLTVGNITNQKITSNRKQEKKARTWAYLDSINITDLICAFRAGAKNSYEIAEYLDITEEFLIETIKTMEEKYGFYYRMENYTVYFNPFGILETNTTNIFNAY